jgi:hypothetical protein
LTELGAARGAFSPGFCLDKQLSVSSPFIEHNVEFAFEQAELPFYRAREPIHERIVNPTNPNSLLREACVPVFFVLPTDGTLGTDTTPPLGCWELPVATGCVHVEVERVPKIVLADEPRERHRAFSIVRFFRELVAASRCDRS